VRRTIITALACASLASAAASCGKQGDLERPGPLWGPKARAEYSQQKRQQAAAASNAAAANQTIVPQNPLVEPYVNPGPIQNNPVPGEPTPPTGAAPGAMPNPVGGSP
jgi:predicted small lipoprotein YifL